MSYSRIPDNMNPAQTKPALSMLMAVLAQMFIVLGLLWTFLSLLGAGSLLCRVPPAAAAGTAAAAFAANRGLLRGRRSLLFMLIADMIMAAGFVWLLAEVFSLKEAAAASGFRPAWAAAVMVMLFGSIMTGLIFQLRWEAGRFQDGTLMVQVQVLFLIGAVQVWAVSQFDEEADMAAATFFMIAGLLAGLAYFKASGMRAESTGGPGRKNHAGMAAVTLASAGLAAGGALLLAEPAGKGLAALFGTVKDGASVLLKTVVTGIGNLFRSNQTLSNEILAAGDNFSGGVIEPVPAPQQDMSFFRILFLSVSAIVILMLLAVIIKMLLQFTIGNSIRMVRRRGTYVKSGETPGRRLKAFAAELRQRIHARKVLRRNPSSVAALVVWLEARCSRSKDLQRRPGETLRAFLTRLADSYPESYGIIMALADKADAACYSRNADLLTEFEDAGRLRKIFEDKEVLLKRKEVTI